MNGIEFYEIQAIGQILSLQKKRRDFYTFRDSKRLFIIEEIANASQYHEFLEENYTCELLTLPELLSLLIYQDREIFYQFAMRILAGCQGYFSLDVSDDFRVFLCDPLAEYPSNIN